MEKKLKNVFGFKDDIILIGNGKFSHCATGYL